MKKQIQYALISVHNKEGLEPIVRRLHALGIHIISTGGTAEYIWRLGIKVTKVEELTNFPEILGGRVKTLHPFVFAGILGRRGNESDREQMAEHRIIGIDLVIVDLYPFEEEVAKGSTHEKIIEKIDIGGVSLIRAAAKNYNDVLVISGRDHYPKLIEILDKGNEVEEHVRLLYAGIAFNITSIYDAVIFKYFSQQFFIPAVEKYM
jgi:phosphoribosylaminoimidazolecarboxamide formyltransferase/IMP cyclohydrolase